jgi:hypothetical protein
MTPNSIYKFHETIPSDLQNNCATKYVYSTAFQKSLYVTKGQSHEIVGELMVWGVRLGPNSYRVLNFSDQFFNSCDFQSFHFAL